MTGKERTINFLQNKQVDRIPFHPLVMQYAAQKTNTLLRDYFLNPVSQCNSMMEFSRNFGLDCVHPSGFPYCEAGAYGLEVEYPLNDLPFAKQPLIKDFKRDIHLIRELDIQANEAMMNRVRGVSIYADEFGDEVFVMGHCEGVLAEYCNLRGVSEAMVDLFENEDEIHGVFEIIAQNAKNWITLQASAGCDCMSIGEAVSSLISENMYLEFVYPFHKDIIKHCNSLGIYTKFHICGDSSRIIPHLINAKANIIDVDHIVKDIGKYIDLLGENQVLCGNIDPVGVIKHGSVEDVDSAVKNLIKETKNKCIVSSGCEVPLDTPEENYRAMLNAVIKYSES